MSDLRPPKPLELWGDWEPNFLGADGRFCLVRCFACDPEHGRENWAPAVASGECAWCGWPETKS